MSDVESQVGNEDVEVVEKSVVSKVIDFLTAIVLSVVAFVIMILHYVDNSLSVHASFVVVSVVIVLCRMYLLWGDRFFFQNKERSFQLVMLCIWSAMFMMPAIVLAEKLKLF